MLKPVFCSSSLIQALKLILLHSELKLFRLEGIEQQISITSSKNLLAFSCLALRLLFINTLLILPFMQHLYMVLKF